MMICSFLGSLFMFNSLRLKTKEAKIMNVKFVAKNINPIFVVHK